MRNGSLPSNIYDRAVYKPIYKYNKDRGTICAADCTSLCFTPGPVSVSGEVSADDPAAKDVLDVLLIRLMSTCAVCGSGLPPAAFFDLTLPVSAEETELRTIIGMLIDICSALDVSIGKTTVRSSEGVSIPQIYMTSCFATAGSVRPAAEPSDKDKDENANMKENLAGAGIVMTGYAGASGSRILAARNEESLKKHFNEAYFDRMRNIPLAGKDEMKAFCEVFGEAGIIDEPAPYIRPAGEGGVYAALWDLSEDMNQGFDVQLKSIPILQETVELCNFLDADPYKMCSDGAFLIVTKDPEGLMGRFAERNIDSALIGCLTRERSRAIINRDEIRCLNRPDMDEILRLNISGTHAGGR
ncbi:MAG: hypothetical protein J5509_05425 [Lachnospiraceae bacterium]|nr:hypothetical protein [Lachnospiraceae bacterium]